MNEEQAKQIIETLNRLSNEVATIKSWLNETHVLVCRIAKQTEK